MTGQTRVLVTGAGGFVGVNLVRRFALAGADVYAMARRPPDDSARAYLERSSADAQWLQGDVLDRAGCDAIVGDISPTAIVHAAAVTLTVEQERATPAIAFDVNAGGTLAMLEAARRNMVRRFVLVSSGGLYGTAAPTPPMPEVTPLRSGSMYAIAKIASEQLCERYAQLYGIEVRIGRLGTAYGPMERTTGSRKRLSAIHQLVNAEPGVDGAVRIEGAEIARDFCHIDDVAEAFWLLLDGEHLRDTVYNVGAPVAASLLAALPVVSRLRADVRFVHVQPGCDADVRQAPESARAAMDLTRLERDTGWRPRYDIERGVEAYFRWLRGHGDLESS